jgi:predicted RNA binding protein YcfA (HicA-like mRNA interferase family)
MKWSELRRIAEQRGWQLYRHGADHDLYRHPETGETILIARHRKEEIKKGTYQKLKKQIGF